MIPFVVDVAHRLPVHGSGIIPVYRRDGDQRLNLVGRDLGIEPCEDGRDGRLVAWLEANEYKTVPDLQFDRFQPPFNRIKRGKALWLGGAAQGSVEIIGPAVIGADQR